jgi:hypothetical protein
MASHQTTVPSRTFLVEPGLPLAFLAWVLLVWGRNLASKVFVAYGKGKYWLNGDVANGPQIGRWLLPSKANMCFSVHVNNEQQSSSERWLSTPTQPLSLLHFSTLGKQLLPENMM